jgi:hypothetical protein
MKPLQTLNENSELDLIRKIVLEGLLSWFHSDPDLRDRDPSKGIEDDVKSFIKDRSITLMGTPQYDLAIAFPVSPGLQIRLDIKSSDIKLLLPPNKDGRWVLALSPSIHITELLPFQDV